MLDEILKRDDVKAQMNYVQDLRTNLHKHPQVEKDIIAYEQWYLKLPTNNISWGINGLSYYNESRQRVADINKKIKATLPKNWVAADGPRAEIKGIDGPTFMEKLEAGVMRTGLIVSVGGLLWFFGPTLASELEFKSRSWRR